MCIRDRINPLVGKQAIEFAANCVFLGTYKLQSPSLHALGTLGGIAHDEHGLAERGGLLLDAARVGQDEMAAREQVVEIENLQGLDHPQAVEAVELRVGGLVHKRVHMNGIDPVSYTHLDVYKRQKHHRAPSSNSRDGDAFRPRLMRPSFH